ncbi:acyltransferase family protein [Dyadobacter frigoris]|uniref:Acyltransferase n=1 Tax=Dyadobacter frigoris TaxID=2576211 RepID=A0A4U6D2Y0_9BACT|nr:acyltransferase [Dyadobacter frigoris]TKT90218.1 acyltransferase [Dyadobacter frigoris]GLU52453.1 acyltransferase [Dyadobacter frigoris]
MSDLKTQRHRFEVLDMFRGIFASLVFLFHLGPFADTRILNNSFVENSDMFVDFFFVLSGFVIAYSYQSMPDLQSLKLFLTKRIYRIYPLHFVMLLAFAGMGIAKNLLNPYVKVNNLVNPANTVYTFFTSLFLINSTPLPGVKDVSWNIPSWSISAEMIAYLVFGMLVVFICSSKQISRRNSYYLLVVVISLTGLWFVSESFQINYSFNYGFLRGILGFFTGVLCFNLFNQTNEALRKLPAYLFSISEIVTITVITTCICKGEELKPLGAIFEVLFFACIFIFSFEKGIISSGLKNIGLLKKLGQYSYSIYMTHAFLISIFNVLFIRIIKLPPTSYSWLFILNFILIYFVSAWMYKNVEMRFQYKKSKNTNGGKENAQVELRGDI